MTTRETPQPGIPAGRRWMTVDGWTVDLFSGEVEKEGQAFRLEPKLLDVLFFLASHAGEVVSKQRFLDEIWPDTAVSDDVVWRAILRLRRSFGDSAGEPKIIETLSRRGYRLVAAVHWLRDDSQPPPATATESQPEPLAP